MSFRRMRWADRGKMLLANPAKLRVVEQQIGEFSALLNEVNFGKAGDALLKSANAQHFAQNDS